MIKGKSRKSRSISLQRKLMSMLILLAMSVSLVLGTSSAIILYTNERESMISEVNSSATAYNRYVQKAIEKFKLNAEAIAQDEEITDMTKTLEQRNTRMAELAEKYGFVEVMAADSTGQTNNNTSVQDRDYFQAAMAGKTYISSTLVRKTDSSIALMVATKVNNGTNFNGIVIAVLSSDTFSKMVDEIAVGQRGYAFIVDKDGKIIAHKNRTNVTDFVNYVDKAKQDRSYAEVAGLINTMMQGKTGTQIVTFEGERQCIGYSPISDTDGWSIAVSANTYEMTRGFYSSINLTVILMMLMVIVSILIGYFNSRSITAPIKVLIDRIQKLAQGDLHSEVPNVQGVTEINTLAQSCASMTDTLGRYVGEMSDIMDRLADGDCTVETREDYKGDFVRMESSMKTIIDNLNQIFEGIRSSANQVANGAEQVSSTAQALSHGATEQASSIEELSATITDIAREVNQNAFNASNASQYSHEAASEVERGDRHMNEMIDAMGEISESSGQIEKIIKVIEDIAFQTNILALNAAVEAARAGEVGKGFAVVADEVRNLAGKSAAAAKDTTQLIQRSMEAVDKGSKTAAETAESLKQIIEATRKTSELIEAISEASNHQATAINQVTQGVDQISAVVQTNSATSEESAATSKELTAQAQKMRSTLAFLRLKEQAPRANDSEQKD